MKHKAVDLKNKKNKYANPNQLAQYQLASIRNILTK